jgi:hypothetical protein
VIVFLDLLCDFSSSHKSFVILILLVVVLAFSGKVLAVGDVGDVRGMHLIEADMGR